VQQAGPQTAELHWLPSFSSFSATRTVSVPFLCLVHISGITGFNAVMVFSIGWCTAAEMSSYFTLHVPCLFLCNVIHLLVQHVWHYRTYEIYETLKLMLSFCVGHGTDDKVEKIHGLIHIFIFFVWQALCLHEIMRKFIRFMWLSKKWRNKCIIVR